jgi:hypothetical protein
MHGFYQNLRQRRHVERCRNLVVLTYRCFDMLPCYFDLLQPIRWRGVCIVQLGSPRELAGLQLGPACLHLLRFNCTDGSIVGERQNGSVFGYLQARMRSLVLHPCDMWFTGPSSGRERWEASHKGMLRSWCAIQSTYGGTGHVGESTAFGCCQFCASSMLVLSRRAVSVRGLACFPL